MEGAARVLSVPALVVQTWFIQSHAAGDYYQIELQEGAEAWRPRLVLVTRDAGWYQDALDAEGRPVWFVAAYHRHGRFNVLEELVPCANPAHP